MYILISRSHYQNDHRKLPKKIMFRLSKRRISPAQGVKFQSKAYNLIINSQITFSVNFFEKIILAPFVLDCYQSKWISKLVRLCSLISGHSIGLNFVCTKSVNLSSLLLPVFNNWFTFCSNVRNYETTSSATCKLFKPSFHTNLYGKNSITVNATDAWNKAQTSLADTILKDLIHNKIKTIIMKKMIDSY